MGRRVAWCLGPESNRHGVSPKGFSYHCGFRRCMPGTMHLWSGLYLCHPVTRSSRARIRQGPSSLYTFLGGAHATTEVLTRATEGRGTRLPSFKLRRRLLTATIEASAEPRLSSV